MKRYGMLVLVIAAARISLAASPAALLLEDGQAILEASPRITLYSLSPHRGPLFSAGKPKPNFHGYPILGITLLTGGTKTQLLGKLYTALAEDVQPARCFNPRHGIRAENGSAYVDLVICFECRQAESYLRSRKSGSTISSSAAAYFNAVLRQAKVPLPDD